ncbi:LysR family glycine cleavage system transcriptional activator [Rhizobium leguminosarum]
MPRTFHDLPSLTALSVFEAAARHGSLKAATAELNVTSGAISRQIKGLERELGVKLFVRNGRGITLTPEGEELYATVGAGFSKIADVSRSIKRFDRSRNASIVTTDTTASMWLVPQMPQFWNRHPDIIVDHQLAENNRNFRPEEIDLRIRYGMGGWMNDEIEPLFGDWLYPVCSPEVARRFQGAAIPDLPDLPLLDVNWVASDWVTWDDALLQGGVVRRPRRLRQIGKFSLAMQAAAAGQGVAIAWHRMIAPLLANGELVRLTDLIFPAPGTYCLTWSKARPLPPAAQELRTWIHELAAEERSRPGPALHCRPLARNHSVRRGDGPGVR